MPKRINKTLVRKVRDYRVDKGLGFKAIAKLMPLTKNGMVWDMKHVKRYWFYGIREGMVSREDIKLVENRTKKFFPQSG